jgi:hypothetical protein
MYRDRRYSASTKRMLLERKNTSPQMTPLMPKSSVEWMKAHSSSVCSANGSTVGAIELLLNLESSMPSATTASTALTSTAPSAMKKTVYALTSTISVAALCCAKSTRSHATTGAPNATPSATAPSVRRTKKSTTAPASRLRSSVA